VRRVGRPPQDDDELLVPVVEVVRALRLSRQELVEAHSKVVPRRDEPLHVRAPALDRWEELLPLVGEDVLDLGHAIAGESGLVQLKQVPVGSRT
jgi:hypothetical protein